MSTGTLLSLPTSSAVQVCVVGCTDWAALLQAIQQEGMYVVGQKRLSSVGHSESRRTQTVALRARLPGAFGRRLGIDSSFRKRGKRPLALVLSACRVHAVLNFMLKTGRGSLVLDSLQHTAGLDGALARG